MVDDLDRLFMMIYLAPKYGYVFCEKIDRQMVLIGGLLMMIDDGLSFRQTIDDYLAIAKLLYIYMIIDDRLLMMIYR